MAIIPYSSETTVIASDKLSADIFRITLLAPQIAAVAKPGCFVMLRVAAGYDPLLRRPFSIHRVSGDGTLQILYKVVGKGTRLLSSVVKDEKISLVGPLGNGFSIPETREKICLVGGGLGAAPLYFLAEHLRNLKKSGKMLILLGARNAHELAAVSGSFTDIGIDVAFATDDGSQGHRGYVADLIDAHLPVGDAWRVYACGPRPMMAAVALKCRKKGFHCEVSLETMMACGIGACLGCTAERATGGEEKYLHVCADGPVFNAAELKW